MGRRPLPGHDGQQAIIGNRDLAGLAIAAAALIARRIVRQSAGLLVDLVGIENIVGLDKPDAAVAVLALCHVLVFALNRAIENSFRRL
ncbi:MAG TPA: hypothetical protein ENN80_06915, partial [Candidatus Hydrogenedentes bacterium]|nr:hypothetical protein [Candidatus Hydrogenedentota bacterium]